MELMELRSGSSNRYRSLRSSYLSTAQAQLTEIFAKVCTDRSPVFLIKFVVFSFQVQGFKELFGDTCGGVIGWLNDASYSTAFTEGWALYAENPLITEETDTYDNDPLQLYGMLKWQIWRALRLMMDTGLHFKGLLESFRFLTISVV